MRVGQLGPNNVAEHYDETHPILGQKGTKFLYYFVQIGASAQLWWVGVKKWVLKFD